MKIQGEINKIESGKRTIEKSIKPKAGSLARLIKMMKH